MNRNLSLEFSSTESDVFYLEQSSEEGNSIRNNTPAVLNSTELSGAMAGETITISSFASPEPHIVTLDSDSNEPIFPYGFGIQQPIVPPSLIDLKLQPNPINVLATMAVIQSDEKYSPQIPEPSILSPMSTPPMKLSTVDGCEIPHATTDDKIFYSGDEPIRVYWDIFPTEFFDSKEPRQVSFASSPSSTPPLPRREKVKLRMEMAFPKKG